MSSSFIPISHRRRPRCGRARTVAMALLSLPLLAGFAAPETGLEGLGRKVSDDELADMRGKFIQPEGISYFGLQLQTSWQGADGITTHAIVLFDVDFANGAGQSEGASPHLMIGWSRDCNGCSDPSMDVAGWGPAAEGGYVAVVTGSNGMPLGGLQSVQGAVQSQNIAGTGNSVLNEMSIAVMPASAVQGQDASGLTRITTSASQLFADGDSVDFILGPNQVGLALASGEGRDFVLQNVNGHLSSAGQHVTLASDLNAIRNSMAITVGMDQLAQSNAPQVSAAMSAMQGHGF